MDSCSTRPRRFDKPFEEYRQAARDATSKVKLEIEANGSISWERVMQVVERDEVTYKLTLKYLRKDGYNIGSNRHPFVTKKF